MSDGPEAWVSPRSLIEDLALPAGGDFSLIETAPADRFVFRGDEAARAACSKVFGLELPARLGPAAEKGVRSALWLGPDEWLLFAEGVDPEMLPLEIATALDTIPHSVVDVSSRQIGLIVRGAKAARVLSAGCPLDLGLKAFPVGMATRTIFDKAEIVLWRRGEAEFQVDVWRSFAPYLVASLVEAARGAPDF